MIPRVSGKCMTRLFTDNRDSLAPLLFAPFADTNGAGFFVVAREALADLDAAMNRLLLDRVRIKIRRCAGRSWVIGILHAMSTRYYRLEAVILVTAWRRVTVGQRD